MKGEKIHNSYTFMQITFFIWIFYNLFNGFKISITRCGVAQLVARRLAVRQARVPFSARHHREVPPLSKQAMKKWREASANGDGLMWLYECLYVCYKNMKNKHSAFFGTHIEIIRKNNFLSHISTFCKLWSRTGAKRPKNTKNLFFKRESE